MLLSHSLVNEGEASPRRWMIFVHGILGKGMNWRTFARRMLEARPGWGAVLVDLRQHGDSRAFPGVNTVEQATEDLRALIRASSWGDAVGGALGHSFGGKVVLGLKEGELPSCFSELWSIDSPPGAAASPKGSSGTRRVFELLDSSPPHFVARRDFVAWMEERGLERGTAQWLATNLERCDEGYRFGLDLSAISELMEDFYRSDRWPLLERAREGIDVHCVLARRGMAVDETQRQRMRALADSGQIHLHELDTGHWVHVEDPAGLLALMVGDGRAREGA